MYEFYEQYWRPFGELLVRMEAQGMLLDRSYLADIQKVATFEQKTAANRFRNWAARYCPGAMHMNVGSDMQLRQLFFGGIQNSKNPNEFLPLTRTFKVLNTEGIIEEGKKAPSKFVNIVISSLGVKMTPKEYTHNGWPSVSGVSLKKLAGKVSSECDWIDEEEEEVEEEEEDVDISGYRTAYKANNKGYKEGKEACHAIAALCDACSINSGISNNILPLQSDCIRGNLGRFHCSLNINTETSRLSARRPNLQKWEIQMHNLLRTVLVVTVAASRWKARCADYFSYSTYFEGTLRLTISRPSDSKLYDAPQNGDADHHSPGYC